MISLNSKIPPRPRAPVHKAAVPTRGAPKRGGCWEKTSNYKPQHAVHNLVLAKRPYGAALPGLAPECGPSARRRLSGGQNAGNKEDRRDAVSEPSGLASLTLAFSAEPRHAGKCSLFEPVGSAHAGVGPPRS